MLEIGNRVLAMWPVEREWWYPGVVVESTSDEFLIQFDDGGRDSVPTEKALLLSPINGTKIQCRWKGGTTFFPGKIVSVSGAAIAVAYDDGDQETTSVSMIRVHESVVHDWR